MTNPDALTSLMALPEDSETLNSPRKLIAWRDGKAVAVTPEEAEELLREGL